MSTLHKQLSTILHAADNSTHRINKLNYSTLTSEEVDVEFNGNYSEANELINIKSDIHLYRADSSLSGTNCIASPNTRKSSGTGNIYNRLVSGVLPSWRSWPKRSHSIIFSNDMKNVEVYTKINQNAKIYAIYPKNSANIVVCPTYDMWTSFSFIDTERPVPDINNMVETYLTYTIVANNVENYSEINKKDKNDSIYLEWMNANDRVIKTFDDGNDNEVIELFKLADSVDPNDYIVDVYANKSYVNLFKNYVYPIMTKYKLTYTKAMDYLMSPDINGFSLTTIDKLGECVKNMGNDVYEMYTDSECLFRLL